MQMYRVVPIMIRANSKTLVLNGLTLLYRVKLIYKDHPWKT